MLVEKISVQWPFQIVFKASGPIASWSCGHMGGPGAGTSYPSVAPTKGTSPQDPEEPKQGAGGSG